MAENDNYKRQIKQMVNFILQEAKEKANEIYVKTEHDFSLEKQIKVHQAKLRIQQEYKQKEKDAETQRRIQRAIVSGEVRVRKMQARDELVQKVKKAAVQKLASHATANQASYAELLKKLVVQGLIKLNESRVEVQCREVDVRIVQKVLEPAAREYERMILDACKETVRVEVVLQDSKYLPGPAAGDGALACAGGVKMSAKHGRIMLDNTLDARLGIAFDDLMPVIRTMLFSSSV